MVDLPVANMLTYIIIIIIHHHHHTYEYISGVPGVPPQEKAACVLPAVHGVSGGTTLPHHPAAGEGGLRVPHQGKGRQYPVVSLAEGCDEMGKRVGGAFEFLIREKAVSVLLCL